MKIKEITFESILELKKLSQDEIISLAKINSAIIIHNEKFGDLKKHD